MLVEMITLMKETCSTRETAFLKSTSFLPISHVENEDLPNTNVADKNVTVTERSTSSASSIVYMSTNHQHYLINQIQESKKLTQ